MNFWQGEKVRLRAIEPADAALLPNGIWTATAPVTLILVWPSESQVATTAWVEEQARRKLENDAFHWVIENLAGAPVGLSARTPVIRARVRSAMA